jgi:hypothetical protein
MTEVGVSLALRRHRNLIGSKCDDGKTKTKTTTTTTNNNNKTKLLDNEKRKRRLRSPSPRFSQQDVVGDGIGNNNGKKKQQKSKKRSNIILDGGPSYSSWRILFEGAALYVFCMVLPNLLGIIVRLNQTFWQKGGIISYQIIGYICSKSWLVESQRCRMYLPNLNDDDDDDISATNSSVLALDAGISDLAIVILLSLSMAITRVALVHFLVPNYRQPKRLEALVQCKSIHLLEFAYSGSVTPTKNMRIKSFVNDSAFVAGIQMPNLNDDEREGADDDNYDDEDEDEDENDVQTANSNEYGNDDADINNIEEIRPMFPSGSLSHLDRKENDTQQHISTLDQRPVNDQDDNEWLFDHDEDQDTTTANDNDNDDAPSVSFGLLTRNSAQNLQALLEQASPPASAIVKQQKGREARRSSQNNSFKNEPTGDRIYAAPKYATAVFRLIYCLVSCLIGLRYFGSADFWPPALGGTGNTRNCWDLSSVGVTNIVDSDFDSSNTVLRRYYLIQASYHVHSAAFHLLTSILLWFVSKSSKNKQGSSTPRFLGFIPIGMFTLYNVQIFFQHIFSLVLIFGTFLFSSTRRLGAIAMFAFDASSLFLHLLQLGINAPHETSKQRRIGAWFYSSRKSFILILHRFLVIPAFCYARFYVFPFVVCYSALEESQDWLHQLENMLIPGTAKFIHGLFVIAFLLFLLLNLTYFWRLLNHPHVTYTLQKQQIKDYGRK